MLELTAGCDAEDCAVVIALPYKNGSGKQMNCLSGTTFSGGAAV
jgi:hypothetical protein